MENFKTFKEFNFDKNGYTDLTGDKQEIKDFLIKNKDSLPVKAEIMANATESDTKLAMLYNIYGLVDDFEIIGDDLYILFYPVYFTYYKYHFTRPLILKHSETGKNLRFDKMFSFIVPYLSDLLTGALMNEGFSKDKAIEWMNKSTNKEYFKKMTGRQTVNPYEK